MKRFAAALGAVFLCLEGSGGGPAWAQSTAVLTIPCTSRAEFVKYLAEKHQEVPISFGVSKSGPLEVYAAPSGSFSILWTSADGRTACIMAAGQNWSDPPLATVPKTKL